MKVDLRKMNKADVLRTLYNNSQPLGLGVSQFTPAEMTIEEAKGLLEEQTYFDYLKGRVMKIDLSRDYLDTWLYNRDNGQDKAESILSELEGFCEYID